MFTAFYKPLPLHRLPREVEWVKEKTLEAVRA